MFWQTIIIAGVYCVRLLLVLHAMFIPLSLKLYPLINAHKFGYWQILCAVILFDFVIISIERDRTNKNQPPIISKAESNPTKRTFSLEYLPHIYNKFDCGYRSSLQVLVQMNTNKKAKQTKLQPISIDVDK